MKRHRKTGPRLAVRPTACTAAAGMVAAGMAAVGMASCTVETAGSPRAFIPFDTLVRACVVLDGCDNGQGETLDACISGYNATSQWPLGASTGRNAYLECVAEVESCAGIGSCTGQGCDAEQPGRCQGNTIVWCEHGYLSDYDCSLDGMVCAAVPDGVSCVLPDCGDHAEGESWCEGRYVVTCSQQVATRQNCAALYLNGTCLELSGLPGCVSTSTCDARTFEPHCRDHIAVNCRQDAVTGFDCTQTPGPGGYAAVCVVIDGNAECRIEGPPCGSLADGACECAATEWRSCTSNVLVGYDCAQAGMICEVHPTEQNTCYCTFAL